MKFGDPLHKVSQHLQDAMGSLNNVYIMAHSGARGNMDC